MSRRILHAVMVGAALVVASLGLGGCGAESLGSSTGPKAAPMSKMKVELDGPIYENVGQLAGAADLVVVGTFTEIRSRTDEADLNGTNGSSRGLPISVWRFAVSEVLVGSLDASEILIQRIDTTKVETDALDPVVPGSQAVLFLRSGGDLDGQSLFAVVGLDQGRLDIEATGSFEAHEVVDSLERDVESLDDVSALKAAVR